MNAKKPLLTISLEGEQDVIIVRRRTKQIGQLLGMSESDQTKMATAVSEVSRNALQFAKKGTVVFFVDDATKPFFGVSIEDKGPGIQDVTKFLEGKVNHCRGLYGARRMVDRFDVDTSENGTMIYLRKVLRSRIRSFNTSEISEISTSLGKLAQQTPFDEVYSQNQELLRILEELQHKQELLDESLRREQDLSVSLENQVQARTNKLLYARDDALQANNLKSQFVANISHELRTPLSSVVGLAELLATSPDLSQEDKELADNLLDSSKKLLEMMNNLLDFTRIDVGKMTIDKTQFSPRELLANVMTQFQDQAQRKSIMLFLESAFDVPEYCYGDEKKITHILMSLTKNALKFTNSGSIKLSVSVESTKDDSIKLKMSVTDTGIGIAKQNQASLFQPFAHVDGLTNKQFGGTGLGLSLTKSYVTLLGGEINVLSEPNRGSTFWFTVPLQCERNSACPTK
ncbi:MAG: ATP-binding protein [Candidatus Melainabacteria bacterium]|nr:ATP-binding protein [Candidatus Melainabacteria bacterium]